jgi:hypothetical protein
MSKYSDWQINDTTQEWNIMQERRMRLADQ